MPIFIIKANDASQEGLVQVLEENLAYVEVIMSMKGSDSSKICDFEVFV